MDSTVSIMAMVTWQIRGKDAEEEGPRDSCIKGAARRPVGQGQRQPGGWAAQEDSFTGTKAGQDKHEEPPLEPEEEPALPHMDFAQQVHSDISPPEP